MPLPHWLTRVNLAVSNRLLKPIAWRAPWFGVLEHVGRPSGTVRQTPLNIFYRGDGRWVVAMTYGPDVEWLKNVSAAGGCRIFSRGRWRTLRDPRRFTDPKRQQVPWIVRQALGLLQVDEFVELREAEDATR